MRGREVDERGRWWMPGDTSKKVTGRLSTRPFSPVVLDLDGLLVGNGSGGERADIVIGQLESGALCTLMFAETAWRVAYFGVAERLYCRWLFFGANFNDLECIAPNESRVFYSNLLDWLDRNPIKPGLVTVAGRTYPEAANAPYEPEVEISPSSFGGVIRTEGTSFADYTIDTARLSHRACVSFAPTDPQDFDWHYVRIVWFRELLSLLTLDEHHIRSVQFVFGEAPVDVVAPWMAGDDVDDESLHTALTKVADVSGVLEHVIDRWFADHDTLEPVVNLLIGTIGKREQVPHEMQFLSLMQAIETFHRRIHEGSYVSRSEWDELRKPIENAIPEKVGPDHRQALKQRLRYLNEYSLSKRMELLRQTLPEAAQGLLIPDKAWIKRAVQTRNFLTHYSDQHDTFTSGELKREVARLQLLVAFTVLRHLGVPEDVLAGRTMGSKQYKKFVWT